MHKIQYRKDRDRYGFVVSRQGKRSSHFEYLTKEEAEKAYHEIALGLEEQIASGSKEYLLGEVTHDYITWSNGMRSHWRADALIWNFKSIILPYFGGHNPINSVTTGKVEAFIDYQKDHRPVCNNTIHHYVVDIKSMFSWAAKQSRRWKATEGLPHRDGGPYGVETNPVQDADLSRIKNRKVVKPELDPTKVDQAAEALSGQDRYFFDCLRYTGMRKDEGNRLQWTDLDLERGTWIVPGTKTEDSLARLPLAPIVQRQLEVLKRVSDPTCPWVFPGRSAQTEGKKIYRRTRMFEKIYRKTGIKLRPKDLRDYFASEVVAKVQDPNVVMRLLRHTNLTTTTKYLRVVEDRMAAAVKGLGE